MSDEARRELQGAIAAAHGCLDSARKFLRHCDQREGTCHKADRDAIIERLTRERDEACLHPEALEALYQAERERDDALASVEEMAGRLGTAQDERDEARAQLAGTDALILRLRGGSVGVPGPSAAALIEAEAIARHHARQGGDDG